MMGVCMTCTLHLKEFKMYDMYSTGEIVTPTIWKRMLTLSLLIIIQFIHMSKWHRLFCHGK